MRNFLAIAILSLTATVSRADVCIGHGGYARCSSSGFAVCEDGYMDKHLQCAPGHSGVRKIKFKKRPDRGQILKPGEEAPKTTLKESHSELKK